MNNTIHISLDLETWGKRPGCDIRSIGAVVFDPVAGTVGEFDGLYNGKFYLATDNPSSPVDDPITGREEYRKYPLHRDPETVAWWNDQTEAAQSAFANPVELKEACEQFTHWLCEIAHGLPHGLASARLWCNGPHFDASILAAVYHAVGLPVPWHFRAPRDFRTIVFDAAEMEYSDFATYGEPHHALHDAIAQAMTMCEAFKRIRSGR